jgi:hypothetical protein
MLRRAWYVVLVCAVIGASLVTNGLRPKGPVPRVVVDSCGIDKVTLALEVCPTSDAQEILRALSPEDRVRLRHQTLADFALIATYAGLWAATGLAIHPAVAVTVGAAAAADVVENVGLIGGLSHPGAVWLIRWAGLTKWALLGLVFLAFSFLFWPDSMTGRWGAFLFAATTLAYGVAGLAYLAGPFAPHFVQWAVTPLVIAVLLQLLVHLTAHGELQALHARRYPRPQPADSLTLADVLREEYARLHGGPLIDPPGRTGLDAVYEATHNLPEKRAALCFSGGGIRSATFALGVMQGLARANLLSSFHYLSTVSGGGYIGGWLTAWLHHSGNDVAAVSAQLAAIDPAEKLAPWPDPISHLRQYSNYLTPRVGIFSADTWTLFGIILRNLILLWVVAVPLLAAILMLPRVYLAAITAASTGMGQLPEWMLLVLGTFALACAVAYIGASIPASTRAQRGQGRFLALCLAPMLVAVVCLTVYWAWSPTWDALRFVIFAVVVHLLAWIGYTGWLWTRWGHPTLSTGSSWRRIGGAVAEPVIVIIVGAAAGYLASFAAGLLFPGPDLDGFTLLYAAVAPAVFIGAFLLAATLLVGLLSRWTEDDDREWWGRAGAWMLVAGAAWLILNAVVLFGPVLLSRPVLTSALGAVGGVSGLFTLVRGWSARTPAVTTTSGPARVSVLDRLVMPAAAAAFLIVLLLLLSTATTGVLRALLRRVDPHAAMIFTRQWPPVPDGPFDHVTVVLNSPLALVIASGVVLALLGIGAALLINTNQFSLHAMYRARLIRAYLGASNLHRAEHRFTGFDEKDNLSMHELWPNPPAAPANAPVRDRLFHVVNLALNLVHGDQLAWQERKAHSFTVSPLHAGSLAVEDGVGRYRRTGPRPVTGFDRYGGRKGISLGTAMTISGAAASPNMGYHSSPLVTFLLTFFNVRLGWWLGNPGPAGAGTFYRASPRVTVRPVVAEAFGLTGRTSPYVYLSDGGHFDNLGLYEMVVRRCHFIVVSDATADDACMLSDLGGAIRKIRVDLGIPIEFPRGLSIFPRTADAATRARGVYWAVGHIRYSVVDPPPLPDLPAAPRTADAEHAARAARDGWLLYLKPAFYGGEPADVYQYAMANAAFPHESTLDQFFSESQFESYRMLGLHAVARLCEGWTPGGSIADLIRHANTPRGPARAYEG